MTTPTIAKTLEPTIGLGPIPAALAELAAGRPIVVVDDASRENEGDLVMPAEAATPELVAFMMRECRGLICTALSGEIVDWLQLPPMVEHNTESMGTAFTVSVDAHGVSTGISAADRAFTISSLADPDAEPADFARPGHVFPLRARDEGVLVRRGHTEAAVDLARLAGLRPAAAIVEIADAHGTMLRLPELRMFAERHGWLLVSIQDLVDFRTSAESLPEATSAAEPGMARAGMAAPGIGDADISDEESVDRRIRRETTVRLPTADGEFRAYGYHADATEQIALVAGNLGDGEDVLVRLHSECLTGDVFGSLRCDCGPQLDSAIQRVQSEGRGVVLYLRGHEGRGIGLLAKLRAYELQERGLDTVDANLELGLPADARDFAVAGLVLADLGVRSVRLITNNPQKSKALESAGIRVLGREAHPTPPGRENMVYLRTKRDRMGHDLPWLDDPQTLENDRERK